MAVSIVTYSTVASATLAVCTARHCNHAHEGGYVAYDVLRNA